MTKEREETIEQMCERIVRQEVLCCMSHVVSTLAQGVGRNRIPGLDALTDLSQQAQELAAPVEDYEEAAISAGWTGPHSDQFNARYFEDKIDGQKYACADWRELCENFDIEPYQWEVFEHWAVSKWLAEALIEQGERVDTDFANLNVWARTTTGQAISMDGCIRRVCEKLRADVAALSERRTA